MKLCCLPAAILSWRPLILTRITIPICLPIWDCTCLIDQSYTLNQMSIESVNKIKYVYRRLKRDRIDMKVPWYAFSALYRNLNQCLASLKVSGTPGWRFYLKCMEFSRSMKIASRSTASALRLATSIHITYSSTLLRTTRWWNQCRLCELDLIARSIATQILATSLTAQFKRIHRKLS